VFQSFQTFAAARRFKDGAPVGVFVSRFLFSVFSDLNVEL